jgi:hypothetical protein
MSKTEQARNLLASIRAMGSVPEITDNWVGFRPPPPLSLLMDAEPLRDEIAKLIKAGE